MTATAHTTTDLGLAELAGQAHAMGSAVISAVRAELLRLAKREDEVATAEAVSVPYWTATPESVIAHRAAAKVLRAEADRFLEPLSPEAA